MRHARAGRGLTPSASPLRRADGLFGLLEDAVRAIRADADLTAKERASALVSITNVALKVRNVDLEEQEVAKLADQVRAFLPDAASELDPEDTDPQEGSDLASADETSGEDR